MGERVTVFGAGAWGLTLADLLSRKGCEVAVWDADTDIIRRLQRERSRGKPPGLVVAETVRFETEFEPAAGFGDIVVCVVPSFAVRPVCEQLAASGNGLRGRVFVCCSKGIEEETLLLPSQVFAEIFGAAAASQFAVLSGPSHAEEVCRGIPTVVVTSSAEITTAERVRDLFITPGFRVYTQSDCLGVELGGALKNVIAIAAGACDGLGFGDNTKAALITRGLAEIARAAIALGARAQTLSGLSGLGDLIVTATSRHSRNRLFGELLATGRSPKQALEEVGAVVEGYRTCRSAHFLSRRIGVEMPITDAIYAVLFEGAGIAEATASLLGRDPKPEVY
jgi:glycerol-3-phosphate dehydrogenase (NAD(P)+)